MAISFSGSAKAEMCRTVPQKRCCALAECFGLLLFCNSFQSDLIRIVTESRELGQRLPKLFDLIDFLIPQYIAEGKSQLVIAFGCTGGKHRSITFAELMAARIAEKGYKVQKYHRDITKDK